MKSIPFNQHHLSPRFAFPALLAAGFGAMTLFCGCEVTVRQPGVVVSAPPPVVVEPPAAVVTGPSISVEAGPVVVEEGIAVGGVAWVEPPIGVDYVLIGGRYAYWHPGLGRWYYRPAGWRLPAGFHAREFHNFGDLERLHHNEVRHQEMRHEEQRRQEVRHEDQKKTQEHKAQEHKAQEKKTQEKKKDDKR